MKNYDQKDVDELVNYLYLIMDTDYNNWRYNNNTFICGDFYITDRGNLFYKHIFIKKDESLARQIAIHHHYIRLKKFIT